MTDQLDVLKLIAARLDGLGIQYMLTGSVAAGWYGQPRTTRDIDLVAVLYPPHAERLALITVQPNLDWAYIDRWAIRLTVKSLLSEMRR